MRRKYALAAIRLSMTPHPVPGMWSHQVCRSLHRLEPDDHLSALALAEYLQAHLFPCLVTAQKPEQVIAGIYGLSVEGSDHITVLTGVPRCRAAQSRAVRRSPRHHLADNHSVPNRAPRERVGKHRNADPGTNHFSMLDQLRDDIVDRVDGHGEPDTRKRPAGAHDHGIDADQTAAAVKQRTTGVSRVDGRIGLNYVFDGAPRHRLDGAVERADHAGGQRVVQSEGIADGEDFLADFQVVRAADDDGR